ncbi:INO80E [Mytilus edulis]|uniref:INO80E n=1 Tax=Mytilus edulis TaxID=6550 RepID=A0A8S3U131_MYTED|nr:INO80E [Mytilus edulis]
MEDTFCTSLQEGQIHHQEHQVEYREKYKALKKKLKFLVYEQECFLEELRKSQRKLLKITRDRSFLLDTGCAPMRYDIAFYFVIDSQVLATSSKKGQVDFAKKVVTAFSVGYMQTRFSCHIYGTTPTELFDFKSKTTVTGINDELDKFTSRTGSGSVETIENLKYIWTDIFTEIKGDRPDIPNYCLMIAIDTIDLRIYDAEAAYTHRNYYTDRQLAQTATKYITISSLGNFLSEATVFTADFTCDYFCDVNYFTYDEPENLNTNADTAAGKITILMDSAWEITCCGVITSWIFYAKASGTLQIGVLRPIDTSTYRIIGFTSIIIPDTYIDTLVTYDNAADENIAIKEGDKIAWYSSGANIISYATCTTTTRSDCPQTTRQVTYSGELETGETIDISSTSAIANKAWALKFTTKNNTEIIIRTNENETELEENTAVGKSAIFLTIEDPDAFEDYEFTVSGDLDHLELNIETMTLDLKKKWPPGGHTSTVTLTVNSYNEPPIINNLPHIIEILETTKTALPLFQINVTDATKDDICCTMPFTLPNTFNFELKNTTDVYGNVTGFWLYTIAEPAFEYSDIDSYRVFVCCQDPYGSSYSYLILRLTEVKIIEPYVPPDWFFRALILSLTPIGLMTAVSCFTLLFTVFWL